MQRLYATTVFLGLLALTAPSLAADVKFPLTGDNTKIEFTGTKSDGKHEGGFKTVTGNATVSDGKVKLEVEIDMDSLYTDTDKLTAHLKSPDFFGVKANPKSKFVTTKVEGKGDEWTVTGDLTLNGTTKSISFPAKVTLGDDKFALKSSFKINRNDFGITYGKGKIDEDVALKLDVNAKK